jgi:putative DNA primase/helicase
MTDRFAWTDLGNAERLVAGYSDRLRHVVAWGWLVWNGRYWERNDKRAQEVAKACARQIHRAAFEEKDPERRKGLAKHAIESQARARIAAMLALAESDPHITAEVGEFDQDPMLLNVKNGTIDLRTGQLRPHRAGDMLAKMIPLDFNDAARSELWDKFLETATAGKDGLADFCRRAAGYTLTGLTREDALFLPHGPGGSGKTTFVESLRQAMGPYAGAVRIEVLTSGGRSAGGHNEDIARLVGLRMVTAVEASDNERLREGQVKHLTGGDAIPASLKHRPGFEFTPVLKLWLATNEVPYIRAEDSGMWRRIHKMPFENVHGKTDLKDELRRPEHLRAVLGWAVRGCLEWQRDGLQVPECVTVATDHLRRRMDGGFEEWLAKHCDFTDSYSWTMTRDVRTAYTSWAARIGVPEVRRVSDARLATILRHRGCEPETRRPDGPGDDLMRGWWGIRVRDRCDGCDACDAMSNFSAHTRGNGKNPQGASQPSQPLQTLGAEVQRKRCPYGLTCTQPPNGSPFCCGQAEPVGT